MRKKVWRVNGAGANADEGRVEWSPAKSIWSAAMAGSAIALAPWHFSWGAVAVFLGLSYATLLLGHSWDLGAPRGEGRRSDLEGAPGGAVAR